jgi:predicted enzyme related to lactoylglutathione lyase
MRGTEVEGGLRRPGGVSYLHIPALDVQTSGSFYESVFGWKIHRDGAKQHRLSFDDATGHVSGAWMDDQAVSREPGFLPYIYVEHIDETVARIVQAGGEIVQAPYAEGNLWVATFRDPAGNLVGIWEAGGRD